MAVTMQPPSPGDPLFASVIPVLHVEGTRSVVVLRGEADISTRRALCSVLCRVIADRTGDVVIDLAEATFVDTAIVRALATAQQLLDRQDRILPLRAPCSAIWALDSAFCSPIPASLSWCSRWRPEPSPLDVSARWPRFMFATSYVAGHRY